MTIRWGIAGLGNIARRFAADLVNETEDSELVAVASRSLSNAQQFAKQFEVATAYGDYQSLADDERVDVVYVATIHPAHFELAALFLQSGKHVLVEKPAVLSRQDWLTLCQLADENDVQVIEAMKSVAYPAYRDLKMFLIEKEIQIDNFEAAFGGKQPFDTNDRLFDPQFAGGATWDVGVYPIWMYCDLCRTLKINVPTPSLNVVQDYPQSRVDDYATFHFNGDIEGYVAGAISRDLPRYAKLKGPDIEIIIQEKWWNPTQIDVRYKGALIQFHTSMRGGGFVYEIEHMNERVMTNTPSNWIPRETSEQVIMIMESALRDYYAKTLG